MDDIVNVLGATLGDRQQVAGRNEISFNGQNLSSGIYFYRIQARNYVETKQMLLLK
jgi:hypothetical protein